MEEQGDSRNKIPEFVSRLCTLNLLFDFVDMFANIALVLLPSGVFHGALSDTVALERAECARQTQRQRICRDYDATCQDEGWHGMVQELAHRGITLRSLL